MIPEFSANDKMISVPETLVRYIIFDKIVNLKCYLANG